MRTSFLSTAVLAMSLAFAGAVRADIVDFLDFSNDGDGVVHRDSDFPLPNSPVAGGTAPNDWVLTYDPLYILRDSTLNEFQALGGVLRVQDFGGEGTLQGSWTATQDGTLDLIGEGVVIGSDAFNGTIDTSMTTSVPEGIVWFYRINGGATVEFDINESTLGGGPVNAGTDVSHTFSGISVNAGDSVEYGFAVAVDDNGDGVEISSYEIDFTVAVPEPSSMMLLGLAGMALVARRRR